MTRIAILGAGVALAAALSAVPGAQVVAQAERPTATPHKDAQQRDAAALAERRRQRHEADQRRLQRLMHLFRWTYPKPGHSVKQGQRMARKARNKARSK